MEKDKEVEVDEEEESKKIEIENSIFAGSMLISRVESCAGHVRD